MRRWWTFAWVIGLSVALWVLIVAGVVELWGLLGL